MIGLIAEGITDVIIIKHLLASHLGIDSSEIRAFRPDDVKDETDKFSQGINTFSNWTIVKEECRSRKIIENFFNNLPDSDFFVIHIDTDRAFEAGYNGSKPTKAGNTDYCQELRTAIYNRINMWIGPHTFRIAYAIAIEETEAWILPIHSSNSNPDLVSNPKSTLQRTSTYQKLQGRREPAKYNELAKPLKKAKTLALCSQASYSLNNFLTEAEDQFHNL
ncbi:hypothetical protein SAMN02745146_3694 [Hymenobacter daecheongensis DSM 21074]|uniref:Uncharacterized protein n=1 Tax=Hymenobacter daecheongensis DSM 21074 TaxID=1121955 RepID=A0A1M6LB95_9BACT|nr:hypothetical protein [Hymenobacter daecheongensis]SHJ68424.1 hypothetical protein SAMN02745146_3694 [Hymenobacter daecheongensis DSM 21074]